MRPRIFEVAVQHTQLIFCWKILRNFQSTRQWLRMRCLWEILRKTSPFLYFKASQYLQHQINCMCCTTTPKNPWPHHLQHVLCHHIGRVVICVTTRITLYSPTSLTQYSVHLKMYGSVCGWLESFIDLIKLVPTLQCTHKFIALLVKPIDPSIYENTAVVFFLGHLILLEMHSNALYVFFKSGTHNWY